MISLLAVMVLTRHTFLMTYFTGNGENGVLLAVSDDGYRFKPLIDPNVPILRPEVGPDKLTRDACILRGPDGEWHMVWTSGWWDRGIGIAHSKDLVHWSKQKLIPVMGAFDTALNTWAPEIAYDGKSRRYVVFWSSTLTDRFLATARKDGDLGPKQEPLNHRYYYTTTRDFKRYAPTKLLWDPGFNCIDATLLPDEGRWLLFGKDETKAPNPAKYLFVAESKSATGPYRMATKRITGRYWAEGPTAIKVDGKFRVFFDRYMDGRWGAVESSDLKSWTDVSEKVVMPEGARHGTVVAVTPEFVANLRRQLR